MIPERLFSRDEANAELDLLRTLLPRLRDARRALIAASERISGAITTDGGGVAGSDWFRAQQTLKADVEELARRGILLKDPEAGLVDFPSQRDGERVLLCWRLDEPDVAWYHDEHVGFRGRKPL
jgi:hypothetical protein